MHSVTFSLAALVAGAYAQVQSESILGADDDGKFWIHGDGISAAFVPYGASLANFLIADKNGVVRDITTGFDNATHYTIDTRHDHFGGVPGRYANRIRNSTFEVDGIEYHTTPNDNPTEEHPDGLNTLHGGPDGWDWRNFTVVAHTNSSITFSFSMRTASKGFPATSSRTSRTRSTG
ncbi:unnamed protein product [Parascedosporium putredinis]|uniref:Aldose 1-epimerase n=1 Tax=Parascedosporium putredinis TaxID=1442378 RepID=A0A9P1H1W4_9PEZI|nr:unnamed protein product [Parascedosporium putredinis]CAI7994164.1 unnamed protein product [Parascedosporium putredinis]